MTWNHMAWKQMEYHVNESDIDRKRLKQWLKKNKQTTFASPSKNSTRKVKKKGYYKAFCVISKRNIDTNLLPLAPIYALRNET